MSGIKETTIANWFVCLSSEKSVSKVFCLWSNPNKEPKLGRSCREELGAVASVGIVFCCRCVMKGVGGRGRVVVDKRGGSAIVVIETSISEVDSVLRLNIESIPIFGLGLSMLEMKPDDIGTLLLSFRIDRCYDHMSVLYYLSSLNDSVLSICYFSISSLQINVYVPV
ncbi:hypothetical protein Tco_1367576 [Tanacetum coccineum]